MKKVSVIMSVYNEPELLIVESVNSILSQTYEEFELIIIADDPNNQSAINVIKTIAKKDDRVSLYINEKNMGLPKSLNRALLYAKGDYIARMDADDIALPERLEKEVQILEELNLDLVATGIIRIDMDGNVIGKDSICYSTKNVLRLLKHTDILPHPTWLAKKELYDALNGYRDFYSCEDYDFLLRAKRINARLGMVPYLLLKYRSNNKGISQSNAFRQALATNYLSKNYKHIFKITSKDLSEYIEKNMTQENIGVYSRHSEKLIRIARKSRINVSDILVILISLISCKYIFYNYKQIFLKKLYSFRGNQRMNEMISNKGI